MKKMSEPVRQHPAGMFILGLSSLKDFFVSQGTREFLIPIALFLWLGARHLPLIIPVIVVILLLAAFFFYGFARWYNFYFYVKDDEFVIHHGVWVRNKISIPRQRVQALDLNYGFWQRLFGVVALKVQTAGESESETEISALLKEDAEQLVSLLGEEKLQDSSTERPENIYKVPFYRLLIAGSTSHNFILIFIIFSVIISQVLSRIGTERVLEYIQQYAVLIFQNLFSIFFGLLVLAWFLSLVHYLYRNFGFSLKIERDRLIINKGFFEKKQVSIPFKRIQAVRIEEGWIRQLLGYANIQVDSAGYGATSGQSTILMPLIRIDQIRSFLEDAIPSYAITAPSLRPPGRALSRYLIRSAVLPLLIGAVLGYLVHHLLLLPFLAFGVIMGYLRFQDAGAGLYEKAAVFRFRAFSRNTVIIPRYRVQSVRISRNLIQHYRRLASLIFYVASAGGGNSYPVSDLDRDDAFYFLHWVSPNITIDEERLTVDTILFLPAFPGYVATEQTGQV